MIEFYSLAEQQAKATAKEATHPSRDINLAPITEDEELPSGNPEDEEEVRILSSESVLIVFSEKDDDDRDENNDDEEGEDDDDEQRGPVRSRRPRPSGGSADRTSGGSGIDEECLDTDDNEATSFDDEHRGGNPNSTERTKVISEEDADFMKAFDALVAESVAVRISFLFFSKRKSL